MACKQKCFYEKEAQVSFPFFLPSGWNGDVMAVSETWKNSLFLRPSHTGCQFILTLIFVVVVCLSFLSEETSILLKPLCNSLLGQHHKIPQTVA